MPYLGRPGPSPVVAALVAADVLRPDDRILDLGCGAGHDAVALATWGASRVVGVDTDRRALAAARRRASSASVASKVRFEEADALDLPFGASSFDVALDTLLLNNLRGEEVERYAREVARVVRPGGLLVVAERVRAADHRGGGPDVPPPDPLPRWFRFGLSVATHLPERGGESGGGHARVIVSVGRRNRRPA